MTDGKIVLKDFTGAASGYFGGIRTPATLVVASTLGALFLFSKTEFSQATENRKTKLLLARLYNALMLASFSLSFTTMILSTVASVGMLHGRFDPMAETAYQLLRREFDFEFVITRWAFIISLLCFIDGIAVRAFLEFDLLRKSKRNHAMCTVLAITAIVSQMLSYINTHLYCWPNLMSMTLYVIQMILRKCWEEQNPLQIVSAVASALAIVFMVKTVFDDNEEKEAKEKSK